MCDGGGNKEGGKGTGGYDSSTVQIVVLDIVDRILSNADSSVCLMLSGMAIGGIDTMLLLWLILVVTVYDC